ncbi:glycine cleavage system protein H [Paenibacillus sp. GCM10023248]|uniref:glycine cleavage system protein H n=1 Tax=unclassified Paenibacillus TaxID=185978 RepID=UPI00237821C4|nr:glycine cleavage system protein H [Paenibacillus sp. MAHUQ-63]MDD9266430.1 glycine cleavage system protein H [Paenibacillus sp. MAHUQ-63]
MTVPAQLRYTRDHYWIRQDGNEAVIGLTELGLIEWGMILFIELPERGAVLGQGDFLGSMETAEDEMDLLAPLSGEVTAVNMLLERATMMLIESPYDKGWLIRMALSDLAELEELWDAPTYEGEYSLE